MWQPLSCVPASGAQEYSPEERRVLLELARESITSVYEHRDPRLPPLSNHLCEPRGAFTTLHRSGELRGCVGFVLPEYALHETIVQTAQSAAFHDVRFPPLTRVELPHVRIEISVMSRLFPICPEDVQVGRHGLFVTMGPFRGLLLPQVPVEYGWDRETFLCQTCRKAGLALDMWRKGAELEAFTAEVFGEQAADLR